MTAKITKEDYEEAVKRSQIKAARGNPRPYSIVKFDWENCPKSVMLHRGMFRLTEHERLVFVGEIPNMPGHCVVWKMSRNNDGSENVTTYMGFHSDEFIELTLDEM